jgi:hypothetical protein
MGALAGVRFPLFRMGKRKPPIWMQQLLLAIAVGLVLGWLGPFRTNPGLPIAQRYGFWLAMAVVGLTFIRATRPLVSAGLRDKAWLQLLAIGFASAVPMTFVVAWTLSLLQPDRPFPPSRMLALYLCVAAVQLLLAFVLDGTRPAPAPAPATDGNALLNRLPREIGTELIAMEAEDHYLRVHTQAGSALILMRLSDAVAAAGADAGVQVHRSWCPRCGRALSARRP